MLKKEFKRKDVDRMRNLIKGNVNASSESQIGYKKKIIERKEGDVWTENKKTWTIKNGIKRTVSKLTSLRKEIFMPLSCPKCNKIMKKRLDKPNYKIHKMCHDCVINFEHKLKIENKYDDYINRIKNLNSLDIVNETENILLDMVNTSNKGYVSEDGVIEKWIGGANKNEFTKKIKEKLESSREIIKKKLNDEEGA